MLAGTAGVALTTPLKAAIQDQYGNIVTTDGSTVAVAVNTGPPGANFVAGSTVTATVINGIATFNNLTLNTAGVYTLKATDGLLSVGTTGNVTISAAAATQTVVLQSPATATAGIAFTPVQIGVEDKIGNVVSSSNSTVVLTLSTGTFSNGQSTAAVATSGGIATFSNLTIPVAGTYTVTVTDGSLATSSFNVTVNAAAATRLVLLQSLPATGTAGVGINSTVTIAAQDAFGNVVTTNDSTVTLTVGPNTYTSTVSGGIATFAINNLAITKSGTYTITASDGSLTKATSSLVISPAIANRLVFTQTPSTGTAGVVLGTALKAAITDQYGNIVTTDSSAVSVSVVSGPGSFATGSTLTVFAVGGVATFNKLVLTVAGLYTFGAADSNSTLTNAITGNITMNPGVASKLVFLNVPGSGKLSTGLSTPVTVAVEDVFGNIVIGNSSTVTLSIGASTNGGSFTTGTTVTATVVNGIATFSGLRFTKAGTYRLKSTDGTLTVASSTNIVIS